MEKERAKLEEKIKYKAPFEKTKCPMKIIGRIIKTFLRRASTKFMDKVGSKVVSGMTDTSSDAPSAFYEPKRDAYEKMKQAQDKSSGESQ